VALGQPKADQAEWYASLAATPRVLVPILALVLAALVALGAGGALSPFATQPALGVYAGSGNLTGAYRFTQLLGDGAQPQYAMDFLDGTSWDNLEHPAWFMQQWGCSAGRDTCSGYHMIWGVPMLLSSGTTLAAEAAGDYDSHFRLLARSMADAGQGNSIIRLGWEFNCGCMPWDASDPNTFIAAYRHVVDDFRSVPGTDFTFEWNPTYSDVDPSAFYPGDAYVDYVGLDVYDGDWGSYGGIDREFSKWQTWAGGLDWLNSFSRAHGKPQFLGEWGLGWGECSTGGAPVTSVDSNVCGGDDPTFIDDLHRWASAHHFWEVTFWDFGTSTVAGCPRSCTAVWPDHSGNPNTAAALAATSAGAAAWVPLPAPRPGAVAGVSAPIRRATP